MVFALKEQNRIIGQLRREANANFMLLDDRSRRTQELVQKLVGKVGKINLLFISILIWYHFVCGRTSLAATYI